GYSAVPPPIAQIYSSPKKDLSWTGLSECAGDTCKLFSRGNSLTQQWEHFFTSSDKIALEVETNLHYQWQNILAVGNSLAVGTHHWKWEKCIRSGNDLEHLNALRSQQSSPKLDAASAIKFLELNALRSQQSSPKLDAASAIKFLELNALRSQQSSPKLDVQLLNLQVSCSFASFCLHCIFQLCP
nr:hypothetical protein [Tanacetum cinerariifolium]